MSQERKNIIFSCMEDEFTTVNELIEAIKVQYAGHNLKYLNIPEIIHKILPKFENMQSEGNISKPEMEVLREEIQTLMQEIEKLKEQNAVLTELKNIFNPERKPCHICNHEIRFNQMIYDDGQIWCKACFEKNKNRETN